MTKSETLRVIHAKYLCCSGHLPFGPLRTTPLFPEVFFPNRASSEGVGEREREMQS